MTIQNQRAYRLTNIDMMRGLVIVVMALDHTRDFLMRAMIQDPMSQPDVPIEIYLTRWVTHFCAPVFVFLAGTSAGLMAMRKSPAELGVFLAKRGLWLIFIEVTVISTFLTLSPFDGIPEFGGNTLVFLQVIWAIGAAMLALAVLQRLGSQLCALIGGLILLGHDALGILWPKGLIGGNDPLWLGLLGQSSTIVEPAYLFFVYPLIPWIGLMLVGFATAGVFRQESTSRDRILFRAGAAMVLAFLLLRGLDFYGDPNHWQWQDAGLLATVLDFMNVSKYPPSLLFLLITLGPMAMLCAYADRCRGWIKDSLVVFGSVPFAFYIAHVILLRLMSLLLAGQQGIDIERMMTFFAFYPPEYGLSLSWIYVLWLLLVLMIFPFCRWFAELKRRRNDWWLSYL